MSDHTHTENTKKADEEIPYAAMMLMAFHRVKQDIDEGNPSTYETPGQAKALFTAAICTAIQLHLQGKGGLDIEAMGGILEILSIMVHPSYCEDCRDILFSEEGGGSEKGEIIRAFYHATRGEPASAPPPKKSEGGESSKKKSAARRVAKAFGLRGEQVEAGESIPRERLSAGSVFALATEEHGAPPGGFPGGRGLGGGPDTPSDLDIRAMTAMDAIVIVSTDTADGAPIVTRPWVPSDGMGPARCVRITAEEEVAIMVAITNLGKDIDSVTPPELNDIIMDLMKVRMSTYLSSLLEGAVEPYKLHEVADLSLDRVNELDKLLKGLGDIEDDLSDPDGV